MRIAWRDDDFRPSVQNSNVQQNNLYVTNNSAVRKSSTSVVSRADSRGRGTLRPTNTNTATNASINRGDARARPVSGTSVTTSSRGFSPARSIASSNMGHNVDAVPQLCDSFLIVDETAILLYIHIFLVTKAIILLFQVLGALFLRLRDCALLAYSLT
jgi:hypothetical protein